jgi:hypothetical protein
VRWPDNEQLGANPMFGANSIWREPGIRRWIGSLGLFLGLGKEVLVRRACASIAHEVGFEFKVWEPPEAKATYKPHPKVVARLRTLDRHNYVAPRTGSVYTVFG